LFRSHLNHTKSSRESQLENKHEKGLAEEIAAGPLVNKL